MCLIQIIGDKIPKKACSLELKLFFDIQFDSDYISK